MLKQEPAAMQAAVALTVQHAYLNPIMMLDQVITKMNVHRDEGDAKDILKDDLLWSSKQKIDLMLEDVGAKRKSNIFELFSSFKTILPLLIGD